MNEIKSQEITSHTRHMKEDQFVLVLSVFHDTNSIDGAINAQMVVIWARHYAQWPASPRNLPQICPQICPLGNGPSSARTRCIANIE